MKTYEAVFNQNESDGVFAISLVHDPAMEGVFVALKKDETIKLAEVDKEQRILMGLVLEPNKPVYRNQNGEEFNIVFNEGTIKDLSYNFFKSNNHKNSTIEHVPSNSIDGVTFVESWIVEDSNRDKSSVYGFNYPKGSWLATMKVDNDEIWEDYVKTGKVRGFSIDAMLSLKEVKLKSNINMSNEIKDGFKELTDKLMVALNIKEKTEEPKIEEELVDSNEVKIKEVNIETSEPELSLDKESETSVSIDEIYNVVEKVMLEYSDKIKEEIIALKKENEDLKKEVLELSKTPAVNKVKSQPAQVVELNSKGRILSKIRNK